MYVAKIYNSSTLSISENEKQLLNFNAPNAYYYRTLGQQELV